MKDVKIELTYEEIKTIYRSLDILKRWNETLTNIEKKTTKNREFENLMCDTLLNPMKLTGDIYRVWSETRGGFDRTKEASLAQHYIYDEYKDYSNDLIEFSDGETEKTWTPKDDDLFKIDPDKLDEYYVSVLRTDNSSILNEKRYLMRPMRVKDLLLDIDIDADSEYFKCNFTPIFIPVFTGFYLFTHAPTFFMIRL